MINAAGVLALPKTQAKTHIYGLGKNFVVAFWAKHLNISTKRTPFSNHDSIPAQNYNSK
jgi:hypothetical protein